MILPFVETKKTFAGQRHSVALRLGLSRARALLALPGIGVRSKIQLGKP
jgi:hypothetical protein